MQTPDDGSEHDRLRADRHAIVEIDHVVVHHPVQPDKTLWPIVDGSLLPRMR
jgi:hypothetical protein